MGGRASVLPPLSTQEYIIMSKKISALSLNEVIDQLQILEYIACNTPKGMSEGDRILRRKLEKQEQILRAKPL
jgi:hypothetical protein